MKKLAFFLSFLLLSIEFAQAADCTILSTGLSVGSDTSEVLSLQTFLQKKGALTVSPNGYFGPNTERAVRVYQDSVGLPDDGKVLVSTRNAINQENCTGIVKMIPNVDQITTQTVKVVQPESCLDLPRNIFRGEETSDVRKLQNFLYKKGLLTAVPNGYYGVGTTQAVKDYQKSKGLKQTGDTLNMMRGEIKNDTCLPENQTISTQVNTSYIDGCTSASGFSITTGISCSAKTVFPDGCTSVSGFSVTTGISCNGIQTTPVINASAIVATSTVVGTSTTVKVTTVTQTTGSATKTVLSNNDIRQNDVVNLLNAIYAFYADTNGRYIPSMITTTPVEICTNGIGECSTMIEVKSSLVPRFLSKVPLEPTTATSTASGYTITRNTFGDIKVSALKTDGNVSIYATCNFSDGCNIKTGKNVVLVAPHIDSIDVATFLSGGYMKVPMVIRGTSFSTSSNIVTLISQGTRKVYTLGSFTSIDGLLINASSSFTYEKLPCGNGCLEILPVGSYDVVVKTIVGESNTATVAVQGVTVSSMANSPDKAFLPKSTHVKLGTISISSTALLDLTSLTIRASSSPIVMASTSTTPLPLLTTKIGTYTLTDLLANKIINSGPTFTFTNQTLSNNQSKIYELYANIADIDNIQSGQVVYSGEFTVKDYIGKNVITIPIPNFIISVSYF